MEAEKLDQERLAEARNILCCSQMHGIRAYTSSRSGTKMKI